MKPSLLMMKPVPAARFSCSRWRPACCRGPGRCRRPAPGVRPPPRAAEEAPEEVVRPPPPPPPKKSVEVLRLRLHLRADVDDHRRLRLGDVAERVGVDRPADRRAVHRRHGQRLRRRGRREIEPRSDDHADGQRGDHDEQQVEKRSLAGQQRGLAG